MDEEERLEADDEEDGDELRQLEEEQDLPLEELRRRYAGDTAASTTTAPTAIPHHPQPSILNNSQGRFPLLD